MEEEGTIDDCEPAEYHEQGETRSQIDELHRRRGRASSGASSRGEDLR